MATYWHKPDGDDKAEWTEVPAGTAFSILNEAVTPPTVPDTSNNYIESSTGGQICRVHCETTTLGSTEGVSYVQAWAYVSIPSANHTIDIEMGWALGFKGATSYVGPYTGWISSAEMSPRYHINQAQLDATGVQIQLTESAAEAGVSRVYAAVLKVVTTTEALFGKTGDTFGGSGGTFGDLGPSIDNKNGSETYTLSDSASLAIAATVSDSAVLSELAALANSLAGTDTFTLSEAAAKAETLAVSVTDTFTLTDTSAVI
jgi:hypothetical protein